MGRSTHTPLAPGGEEPGLTRDEALAFIDSLRLMLEGKAGFSWLAAKLARLSAYVARTADDAERISAFIESRGLTDDYRGSHASHGSEGAER